MAPKKEVGSKKKDDQRRSKDPDADSSSVEQEAEIPVTDNKIAISDRLVTCEICLDVMHNAMNVTPCNHKFCAGCIYEWHSEQEYCPKCRWYVQDITRDPLANELIEAFLVANPSRTRNEECKTRLDERELFHLEQYNCKHNLLDTTIDIDDSSLSDMGADNYSDDESDDEYMSDFEESDDSYSEARDLEIKARRDIDVARMDRLRREKEERERQKTEADAAAKKRTGRKRTNDRRSGGSPVASRLRERPQPNLPARASRRQMN